MPSAWIQMPVALPNHTLLVLE